MQNQSQKSSVRSSFSRRMHNELVVFLMNDVGLQAEIAQMVIDAHQPSNKAQALALFLTDESDLINHFFIPPPDQSPQCRVCGESSEKHKPGAFDWNDKQIQRESQHSRGSIVLLDENEDPQGKQVCQICYIEVANEEIFFMGQQKHNICLKCMSSYVQEEINNMRVQRLSCPHCGRHLDSETIKDLTDNLTFNKYRLFLRNLQIQKSPNLKWCPNPKCSIVINTNPNKKNTKCPKCSTQICNKCGRQAHPRSSCEGAFKKQIKGWQNASDIQKCKKCQGLVQKIAGCNHMTCSICRYEWCWLCGSDYSTAHFSALNPFGCPGLQDRPRDDWGKCKILLLRIGLLLLILLGIPVALPIGMIASGPLLIGNLFWNCIYPNSLIQKAGVVLLSTVLGLISDPIVWIGSIIYFVPLGISKLISWHRQRKQIQQRRNSLLQQRLLGQQIFEEPEQQQQ